VTGTCALRALRIDDVGAAAKRNEVYGTTRVAVAGYQVPVPGNFLFLKYVRPFKRWGPYRELTADEWDQMLEGLEAAGARMTVAITAGWVEDDGRITPFPRKFAAAAAVIARGVESKLLEVANHGYTHCVLDGDAWRPRWFSGNRTAHREFYESLPAATHREHVGTAQAILTERFGDVMTFVPPGNVFARATLEAARDVGLACVSCRDAARFGAVEGLTYVDDAEVLVLHDRDVVLGGVADFRARLSPGLTTVRAIAARAAAGRSR
jgi:hypothetical protein